MIVNKTILDLEEELHNTSELMRFHRGKLYKLSLDEIRLKNNIKKIKSE